MARSKSHNRLKEDTKPTRGAKQYPYVVYASKGRGEDLRVLVLKWETPQEARNMIEGLKGNATYEIKRSASDTWNYMLFEDGMRVSLRDDEQHKEVMELEFDDEEKIALNDVLWFKYRQAPEPGANDNGEDVEAGTGNNGGKKSKRKSDRKLQSDKPRDNPDKQPKEKRKPVDKSGKISANQIAEELGVTGRDVRGVLRAMKLEKPEGGWLFDEKTADDIRKKVKDNLKKKK